MVLELPWQNTEGRAVAELTALPARTVMRRHGFTPASTSAERPGGMT